MQMTAQGALSALGLLVMFAGLFWVGGWLAVGEPPKPFAEATGFYLSGPVLQSLILLIVLAAFLLLIRSHQRSRVLTGLDQAFCALWTLGSLALGCAALILFLWAVARVLFGLSDWPPFGWPLSRPETWWMELAFGLFGLSLTVAIPSLLRRGGHVSIDVIHERLGQGGKAWVARLGNAALALPVGLLLLTKGSSFAARSWGQWEASQNFGIGFVFLVKTLVPLMGFLILCAAAANLIERTAAETRSGERGGRRGR